MWLRRIFALAAIVALATAALAQFRGRGRSFSAPEFDRGNVPEWALPQDFKQDCFTFVRIKYRSSVPEHSSYAWWTDYPDADINFSWRLHQLTALAVDPQGKVIDITDPDLFNYPFAVMSGVPNITMDQDEISILRRYLNSGGFLMIDDFWGGENWDHFNDEVIQRIYPGRAAIDLQLTHPIFHAVFELKEQPQIPSVFFAMRNRDTGITAEHPDGQTPHYRAVLDDKGRMVMLACHNTDVGDGWEEEGTDPWYFTEFSEKKAYPLGINILFYAMTH